MIDTDHLAHATAGDAGLQVDLLGLFEAQLDDVIKATRRPDADTAAEWCFRLHRLRSAALAIGARPLARELAAAEANLQGEYGADGVAAVLVRLVDCLGKTAAATATLIAARRGGGLAKLGETV